MPSGGLIPEPAGDSGLTALAAKSPTHKKKGLKKVRPPKQPDTPIMTPKTLAAQSVQKPRAVSLASLAPAAAAAAPAPSSAAVEAAARAAWEEEGLKKRGGPSKEAWELQLRAERAEAVLVQLKRDYPDRVFLIAGNRDINKLRLGSELAPGRTGASTDVYWDPASL